MKRRRRKRMNLGLETLESRRLLAAGNASFSISVAGLCTGTFHAFSSVVIPMVQKPESEGGWEITLEQGSWIGKAIETG